MQPFDPIHVELRGMNLVEASAGTGKTHAITSLVLRLITEENLSIQELLVVTFTEAAASELRERIRSRLKTSLDFFKAQQSSTWPDGPPTDAERLLHEKLLERAPLGAQIERLKAALRDFDDAIISTIHSFCQRSLLDTAFESAGLFDLELVPNLNHVVREIVTDFWTNQTINASPELLIRLNQKLPLGRCFELAKQASSNPDLVILPHENNAATPNPQELLSAVAQAQHTFYPNELRAALLASGINKTKLKPEKAELLIHELGALLGLDPHLLARLSSAELPQNSEKIALAALPNLMKKGASPPDLPFFSAWQAVLDAHAAHEAAWDKKLAEFATSLVHEVRTKLPSRKQERGQISFDDLLQQLDRALSGPQQGQALARRLARRYPAGLIDEFQDTDSVQWRIFKRIYGEPSPAKTLFLIGDPKQAIYSFRGADLAVYFEAVEATPAHRRFTMLTNWRSDPGLLRALNQLYGLHQAPLLEPRLNFPHVNPRPDAADVLSHPEPELRKPLQLLLYSAEARSEVGLPELAAQQVARALSGALQIQGRPAQAHEIAVLTRSNQQALQTHQALSALQVPSVVLSGRSVFQSEEAQELYLLLQGIAKPSDLYAVKTALLSRWVGLSANQLVALEGDDDAWEEQIGQFLRWNQLWHQAGIIKAVQTINAELSTFPKALEQLGGERRLTNLRHLSELLHDAERSFHFSPLSLLKWFKAQLSDEEGSAEDAEIRLESDASAVQIVTIHKSKGLQYPIVFCPFLSVDSAANRGAHSVYFHDNKNNDQLTLALDLGGEITKERVAQAAHESFAENLRLLYVALTRAKHQVVIFWGPGSGFSKTALGYLLYANSFGAQSAVPDAVSEYIAAQNKAGSLADALLALAAQLPDLNFSTLETTQADPWQRPSAEPHQLTARSAPASLDDSFRTTSYSGLAAGFHPSRPQSEPEKDYDLETGGELAKAQFGPPQLPLLTFPYGSKAGNFFHDLLEHYDFSLSGADQLSALTEQKLLAHGFDSSLKPSVVEGILALLSAPLRPSSAPQSSNIYEENAPCKLAELSPSLRLNELQFYLPIGLDRSEQPFNPKSLAKIFEENPSPELPARYAERVRSLSFRELNGYLKGFIDLVFRSPRDGRYYIVDYKSNYLGDQLADYSGPALNRVMSDSHYYLQYHLYTLALTRYLKSRIRGYDYHTHFGGVYYLFLRGIPAAEGERPAHAAPGVFYELPPEERIEGLAQFLAITG